MKTESNEQRSERHSPERVAERLVADRKVRAVAQAGSHGTEFQWAGSVPTFVSANAPVP